MNAQEQMGFVSELMANVTEEIIKEIIDGKIPENWDGIELRQLIADTCRYNAYPMSRSRKRAYNNTVIVNDL